MSIEWVRKRYHMWRHQRFSVSTALKTIENSKFVSGEKHHQCGVEMSGSAVIIKQEKDAEPVAGTSGPNASEIEKRIIELCQEFPKGITDKVLQNDMPNLDTKMRVSVINKLLTSVTSVLLFYVPSFNVFFFWQGRVDLFKQNNELIYRMKDSSGVKVKGGEMDEKLVYKLIEEAGNKGIWARDIRFKSNISLTQLNKILKALEGKKLVKAVTSVSVLIF